MNRPRLAPALAPALALALLSAHGCGFTSEPDPGHGDVDFGGGPANDAAPVADGGIASDSGGQPDAYPPPLDGGERDAQAADAAVDQGPGDLGPADLGPDGGDLDAGDLDAGDLDPPDHALDAGDPDLDPTLDAADPPDLAPQDPLAAACQTACATLAACPPATDPAICQLDCRARAPDPDTVAACHDTHLAADRCHSQAYNRCLDGLPPPIDPTCTTACEALTACPFPANPDCALECDAQPGPSRRHLARCAQANTTGPCDLIGFITCAATDPTAEDHCAYTCAVLTDCQPDPDCPATCAADPDTYDARCIETHLDRGACAEGPYQTCLAAP